jgi:predicted alpha/beta superfamily hydrolase
MERDYRIHVSTPVGYDPDDEQVYPVVYLLDAQWYWEGFYTPFYNGDLENLVGLLSGQGLMPRVIIVGIDTDSELGKRHVNLVTDSKSFYRFIATELVPYIDQHYRTDPKARRTLIGHSDGCYFVLYALFQARKKEHTFNNFIGLSGDHGQHERENFLDEMRLWNVLGTGGSLDASLFLIWGQAEEDRFLTSNKEMVEVLERRDYQGFRFKSFAYEELTHGDVVFPGILDGLVWVFGEGQE